MAAFAVLVVALLTFSCVADAVVEMPTAVGFNAAKCPPFPKGGCTHEACGLPSAGQLYKFRVSRGLASQTCKQTADRSSRDRASDMKFMRYAKRSDGVG